MVQTLTYDYSHNDTKVKDVPLLINLPSVSRKQRKASTNASSLVPFDLLVLPPEVQMGILLEMTPFYTVVKLSVICKQLRELLEVEHLWKMINDKHFGSASFVGLTWKSSVIKKTQLYFERFPDSPFNQQFFIDNGKEVLSWAARHGHTTLLAKVHTLTGLDIEGWYPQKESYMLASPLFLAASEGHVDACEKLINMGACIETGDPENNTTPLYIAAYNGHPHIIDLLVRRGANINIRTKLECLSTPLTIAVKNGHKEAVSTLLKHGADVSFEESRDILSPLHIAVLEGYEEITEMLLRDGKTDLSTVSAGGASILYVAAYSKHPKLVDLLITYGANVNRRNDDDGATAAYIASFNGDLATLEALKKNNADFNLQRGDGMSPLAAAAYNDKVEAVDFLIKCGVNVNTAKADGATPLYMAARKGLLKIVEALIEGNANIDQTRIDGVTPINVAAKNGCSSVVRLLVEKGAQVNLRDYQGVSPLSIASEEGHREVVKILLTGSDGKGEKANPNILTNDQASPIYLAVQKGDLQIVSMLLEHGADPNLARLNKQAPIHACVFRGHSDILDMLLKAQANPNATRADGIRPLILAVHSGKTRDLVSLIHAGAELNPTRSFDGATPLLYAACFGEKRKSAILTLLVFGADPHIARNDGSTTVSLLGDQWKTFEEKAGALSKEKICAILDEESRKARIAQNAQVNQETQTEELQQEENNN